MAWLTAGWVRCSFLAAREKLRSRATVTNTFKSSKVMTPAAFRSRILARSRRPVNKFFD
jgi:hypothetical protein